MNAIRAEVRKLLSTQTWFWLLVGSVSINVLIALLGASLVKRQDEAESLLHYIGAYGVVYFGFVFVLVLGAIGMTAEFRYQTITPTVLATPSRLVVVAAKVITYLVAGAAYAAVGIGLGVLIAVPILSLRGFEVGVSDGAMGSIIGCIIVFALFAVFGVGFGSLITNQAAAVTLPIIFTVVVQPLLLTIPKVKEAFPYMPTGASWAVVLDESDSGGDGPSLLTPVQGGVVLLLWGVVLASFGIYRLSKDIT